MTNETPPMTIQEKLWGLPESHPMTDCGKDSVEEWRPVPDYEGLYDASSLGRVRSHYRDKRILSAKGTDESGYPVVSLNKGGKRRTYTLHRLIALAFHGHKRNALHREVAHLDGVQANCHAANLKWVSRRENEHHKIVHGTRLRGEASPCSRFTEDQVRRLKRLLAKGVGVTRGAKITGVSYATARGIAEGRCWRHVTTEFVPAANARKEERCPTL